ncbi:hypothetical protein LCGC14_0251540 [marine sediment metagenome]|uniref:Uncharacterized protein n=1 Tax=marine sediment metagenome TaxID=412755 RepID=A0A0F9UKV9_9ZZZZ
MPKIKNGRIPQTALGIAGLCQAHPAPFLALKLRRIRRAITTALEDQEAIRQECLDEHAQKDKNGKRKLVFRLEKGKKVKGEDGEFVQNVVFKDKKAFEEAFLDLVNTEVDFVEFITSDDIEDERHPKGFSVSADELDSLGPLFVDSADTKLKKKPGPKKGKGAPKGRMSKSRPRKPRVSSDKPN